jgi:hypothetical protein
VKVKNSRLNPLPRLRVAASAEQGWEGQGWVSLIKVKSKKAKERNDIE